MHSKMFFLTKYSSIFFSLLLLVTSLQGEVNTPFNKVILEALSSMPHGGGYSTSSGTMERLRHSVTLSDGKLAVHPAAPSFCSEATYLVFLKTVLLLQERRELSLHATTLAALLPRGQADGEGIWGRWNANGPGVACLFYDGGLGRNFTDLGQAEPGDFLKIFWSESIGATEHGHLVVYLGHEKKNNIEMIHFWSSNQQMGYGDKWVPLRAMHHLIFSRLTNPLALAACRKLPRSDAYLASLLSRTTTWEEVKRDCGIKN